MLGSPSCPRTLGKTLAHIQSMISEEQDTITEGIEDMESEDDSVFQASPFVARLVRSICSAFLFVCAFFVVLFVCLSVPTIISQKLLIQVAVGVLHNFA